MSSYDFTFKILLLGGKSVGKQSLTKRYCYNIFNPTERLTIGVDFHAKIMELHGRRIKLHIWDVGGEERFRFLFPTYCLGANGALLLYDITRSSTLDNIPEWVSIFRQKAGAPIMLVGSKLDLEEQRVISTEQGRLIAEKCNFSAFAEVSAKTGQNVNLAFQTLAEITLDAMRER
ncbi:MAG: Rab family GTPase [Promethearchaeia archaeon]